MSVPAAPVLTRLGSNRGSDHVAPRPKGQGDHTPLSLPFLTAKPPLRLCRPPCWVRGGAALWGLGPGGSCTETGPLPGTPDLCLWGLCWQLTGTPAMALCPVPAPEQSMASPPLPPHCLGGPARFPWRAHCLPSGPSPIAYHERSPVRPHTPQRSAGDAAWPLPRLPPLPDSTAEESSCSPWLTPSAEPPPHPTPARSAPCSSSPGPAGPTPSLPLHPDSSCAQVAHSPENAWHTASLLGPGS